VNRRTPSRQAQRPHPPAFSRRTIVALRAALPMRLALPHLEPVLMLNVGKEVEKDTP
jgi:hypothetical protein